ncbi:hypothetical protein DOY81_000727 [Sarcophaga bullata]|nr:hypothetical protein DOY81_000727 [Sarcophaga bullata]
MSKLKLSKIVKAPCGDKVRRIKSSKSKRAVSGSEISKTSYGFHQCQWETRQLIYLPSLLFSNCKLSKNQNGEQQETTKFFKNWQYENIQSNN